MVGCGMAEFSRQHQSRAHERLRGKLQFYHVQSYVQEWDHVLELRISAHKHVRAKERVEHHFLNPCLHLRPSSFRGNTAES